jgi:hypothetical protein
MIEAPELPNSRAATKARIVDGMLECWAFNVDRREWMMRHDAIVNGERLTIAWQPIPSTQDVQAALSRHRPAALASFQQRDRSR